MARATLEALVLRPRVRRRVTPEARWDDVLVGQGRAAKKRSKLVANRHRNWLIAVTTLACAKAKANQSLSDLEQHIVKSLRSKEVGERLISAMAHVHAVTPAAQKRLVLSRPFCRVEDDGPHQLLGFGERGPGPRAPDAAGTKRARPRYRRHPRRSNPLARADDPAAGESRLDGQFPSSARWSQICRLLAAHRWPAPPSRTATRSKPSSFRCLEESSEWSDSDEVYRLFGSVAKGFEMTNGTKTYNGVDAGEALNLENDE